MKTLQILLGCLLLAIGASARADCFGSIAAGSTVDALLSACGEPNEISDITVRDQERIEVYRGLSREREAVRRTLNKSIWSYRHNDELQYRFVIIDGYVMEKLRP